MAGRLARLRRLAPPAALFVGLFIFGMSLFSLGSEASRDQVQTLEPSKLVVTNGTAVLVYPVEDYAWERATVNVSYSFPQAAGDAYFVGCQDTQRLLAGERPEEAGLVFVGLRENAFKVNRQTVGDHLIAFADERGSRVYCAPSLAFLWAAPGGDPAANHPAVSAVHEFGRLGTDDLDWLFTTMVGGALLSLFGGLAWARVRAARPPAPPSEDSTVEALRSSLDRMAEQLERTRRHLLFAGVLGVFLWYPILVPWAWQQAARASDAPIFPWAVAGMTLVFLLVLTILWAREFVRLDRELDGWRDRLEKLRQRETHLMDTLDGG